MDNFLNDVISFEKEIGGDVNIFEQFEKKKKEKPPTEARKELIKKLFVSSKKMKNNAVSYSFVSTFKIPVRTRDRYTS